MILFMCRRGAWLSFFHHLRPAHCLFVSYLVLARKSRPQRFAEVIGQRPVVRTLENALTQRRVAHAIIFSGVRGTGKTTLARIMAKALNCVERQGPEPCNQCRSCREISAGTSVDLQEVDGASNRGIQEIRELKERIRFQPSTSRYKIFIIDEVHMLTTEAFNALLKTLEEPPEHVYFMFATTELHKVPLTILSRCQRFELKRLTRRELHSHFAALAEQEGVAIDDVALDMVAREAAGSVRDGLSLLDQLFSYCGKQVNQEDVLEVLGLVSRQSVAELGTALLHASLPRALELVDALHGQGVDLKRLGNDLLQWLRELLLCKLGPKTAAILALPDDELATLQELAAPCSQDQLLALFNVVMDTLEQGSQGQQPKFALEMACIRATQVADITPTAELITRFNALLGAMPASAAVPPAVDTVPSRDDAAPAAPRKAPESKPPKPRPDPERPSPAPEKDLPQPPEPATAPPPRMPAPEPPCPPAPQAAPAPEKDSAASLQARVEQGWNDFTRQVQAELKWMGLALQQALGVQVAGDCLLVRFRDTDECSMLRQKEHHQRLTELVADFFHTPLTVRIEGMEPDKGGVNPLTGRTPQEEHKALACEPMVLTALEIFNGDVHEIRTGERYTGTVSAPEAEDLLGVPEEDD